LPLILKNYRIYRKLSESDKLRGLAAGSQTSGCLGDALEVVGIIYCLTSPAWINLQLSTYWITVISEFLPILRERERD